ncbi:MAG: hypothetical protein FWF10_04375 [Clostridiales bacterium]|nr:hypothetical protein [Clostridiales bacterium]
MSSNTKTRMFAPRGQQSEMINPVGEEEILPAPVKKRTERGFSTQSKVLLILAIFFTAAAAIFGLRGNAEIAKLYIEIGNLESQIADVAQKLSNVIKDQGQLHGYNSIYNANEAAGRVLFWDD